jgi:DNA-binding response OmpR family regulator
MARILSVSYNQLLLRTRQMLLESKGHEVVSSLGFTQSFSHCKRKKFDLFILGHSIPHSDKRALITAFRKQNRAPIISLRRSPGDELVDGADYHTETDPELLLQLVDEVLSGKN